MSMNYPSSPHGVPTSENITQTDWSICALCQNDSGKSVIHPDKGNIFSTGL